MKKYAFITITGKNTNGTFDLLNDGEINNNGTMYTDLDEALKIQNADLTNWEEVIIECWISDDEIGETIIIKD